MQSAPPLADADDRPGPLRLAAMAGVGFGAPLAAALVEPLYGGLVGLLVGAAGLVWLRWGDDGAALVERAAPEAAGVVAELGDPALAVQVLPETAERPALVAIAPGRFVMGSPPDEAGRFDWEQQRPVELTRGFWMAETPVTQAQYAAVMGHNPACFQGAPGDDARPVEQVSWLDAVRYCNALSAREGLAPAYVIDGQSVSWDRDAAGYRLPTEAEWEYAARAGTTTATYAGDLDILGANSAPALDAIAWYGGNSGSAHPEAIDSADWPDKQTPHARASTHPVKGKAANRWGLYDMLGNVYEWTWDWYTDNPAAPADGAPLADPAGPARGGWRVVRGGSFDDFALRVRAALRFRWWPGYRYWGLGFRPVRSAPRARP